MSYPGSKAQAGTWQRIIGQMPPHRVYIEPFAGSAQVYLRKRAAELSILIDASHKALVDVRDGADGRTVKLCGDMFNLLPRILAPLPPLSEPFNDIWQGEADDVLIYADPPYVLETRRNRRYYDFEMTDDHHASLLALLQGFTCKVMLSGYPSKMYAAELTAPKWRCLSYQTRTRGRTLTECLWMNFEEPAACHDWRYAGRTYRERQSLSKLKRRWLARLQRMTPRHRGFILDAISQRQF